MYYLFWFRTGLFLVEFAQKTSKGRCPNQMPKQPQLAPFDAEKQWLCSKLSIDDQTPHPISKSEPSLSPVTFLKIISAICV